MHMVGQLVRSEYNGLHMLHQSWAMNSGKGQYCNREQYTVPKAEAHRME